MESDQNDGLCRHFAIGRRLGLGAEPIGHSRSTRRGAEDVGAVARVEIEAERPVRRLHQMGGVDKLRHPTSVAGWGDEGAHEREPHSVVGAQQADGGLRPAAHAVYPVLNMPAQQSAKRYTFKHPEQRLKSGSSGSGRMMGCSSLTKPPSGRGLRARQMKVGSLKPQSGTNVSPAE